MLKRCLSPLTLVNQVALIVLLSTAIGLAGMAVSGWLVQGVQGSAHAINKAGSLRMQSYRCIDSLEVRKKPGGHWIIRDLMGLDLVGLASL